MTLLFMSIPIILVISSHSKSDADCGLLTVISSNAKRPDVNAVGLSSSIMHSMLNTMKLKHFLHPSSSNDGYTLANSRWVEDPFFSMMIIQQDLVVVTRAVTLIETDFNHASVVIGRIAKAVVYERRQEVYGYEDIKLKGTYNSFYTKEESGQVVAMKILHRHGRP